MESGDRLGPYEIVEPLGAGGMGEVWLARDERLGRDVAIKVLPQEYASDPERLARFEQEARAAAALNHPHIAVVHDVGHEDGVHFIVQERLEGRTLREVGAEGRPPLVKGLRLALEIVEALGAAHKAGIVHRDLKPENVFVIGDGHAKVLDFGLAKLTELATPGPQGSASMSPTVLGTVAGQMMGTAGYMAPEQIEGVDVDHRADLFAFGCVLFELAAGQRAFEGKNLVDTLHRVSNVDPDPLGTIDGSLPVQLQTILDKALAKDPAERYQTAADLAVDLRRAIEAVQTGAATPVALAGARAGGGIGPAVVGGVAVTALVLGAAASWWWARPEAVPAERVHLEFTLVRDDGFHGSNRRPLSISRDGRKVAFTDEGQIWVRDLGSSELVPVRGTDAPRTPVFSPDGQWIAYASRNELLKIPVTGGAPVKLADLDSGVVGMSWHASGSLVYATDREGILRVSENGGEPDLIVAPSEAGEQYQGPLLLPGDWLVFARRGTEGSQGWSDSEIVARSLGSGEERVLVYGGQEVRYQPTGHLLYVRDGNLFGVPFDVGAIEVGGGAVPLLEGIALAGNGGAYYDVSDDGDLVYFRGATVGVDVSLAFYDLEGNLELLPFESGDLDEPAIAPDGNRIAVIDESSGSGSGELWLYEIDRAVAQRLTPAGVAAASLAWSPDGEWVYFAASAGGLYRSRSNLTGDVETVADDFRGKLEGLSPDGNRMLYTYSGPEGIDIGLYAIDSSEERTIEAEPWLDAVPRFSPDGRHVAYMSGTAGEWAVFVRDLETSRRHVVADGGAVSPFWSPSGDVLYFRRRDTLWSVTVSYEPEIAFGRAAQLFDMPALAGFPRNDTAITPDGRRVLIMTDQRPRSTAEEDSGTRNLIQVVTGWSSVLQERVRPTG